MLLSCQLDRAEVLLFCSGSAHAVGGHHPDLQFFGLLNQMVRACALPAFSQREGDMNSRYKVALAMTAGIALGAAAVQGLHAQAKPAGYVVVEVAVKDPDKYKTEFLPPAIKAIEDAGGKYIVRGGKTVSYQGAPPASRVVVLQFENMDKAQAWYDSRGRKDSQTVGDKYATFRIFAVEGASP
ncbi:MAG: DUF1330 domain-containing protein [Steroidobacteraceae bacterium]